MKLPPQRHGLHLQPLARLPAFVTNHASASTPSRQGGPLLRPCLTLALGNTCQPAHAGCTANMHQQIQFPLAGLLICLWRILTRVFNATSEGCRAALAHQAPPTRATRKPKRHMPAASNEYRLQWNPTYSLVARRTTAACAALMSPLHMTVWQRTAKSSNVMPNPSTLPPRCQPATMTTALKQGICVH